MERNLQKAKILGCRVDVIDMPAALSFVDSAIKKGKPSQIITLNAEMIYRAQYETELCSIYANADLVTPDGIGTIWALKRAGYPNVQRVTGIDLTQRIMEEGNTQKWSVYLFGGRPGVASELKIRLEKDYPLLKVVGTDNGYFTEKEEETIIARIQKAKPQILLVALGAPKQEYWIAKYLDTIKVPVCIGIGGTFDVLAGFSKRAPRIWRNMGLEWLYRLLREPSRLERQLALPRFAFMVLRDKKN
ncbi:MAG: WecB/TagA/CpsF family glycosyltransferase [Chitinophagales bacterium]